jgi:protein TonB
MYSACVPLSFTPRLWPRAGRLHRFVLLSLALHAVVLLITNGRSLLPDMDLGQSTLHVRLEAQRSRNDARATQRVLQRMGNTPTSLAQSLNQADTVPNTDTGVSEKTAIGHEALQNYLLGALNSELARYLTYPPLARERGWQGTVVVGVGIAPGGLLYNMRLVKSSGFSLLDQASLASLRMIKTLPVTATFDWGGPVEVILPIQFHLTDNS